MAHGDSPRHARRPRSKRRTQEPAARAGGSTALKSTPKKNTPLNSAPTSKGGAGTPAGTAAPGLGAQRLQKLLAAAGFGSRRVVESFLKDERVTVNGRVAKLGDRADPMHDEIRVDGERLARERPAYWIVNKPRGVVTTVRDEAGRRTVVDLLPPRVGRLFPVGRLDRETSGLLLMTNDGDTAHVLLHPSLGNEREYRVQVKGRVEDRTITRLERGVPLEEGRTSPMEVSDVRFDPETGTTQLGLTLVEGKKRQIRRSLLVLGHPVRRLVRVRMGPLRIGRLAIGEARVLRSEEKRLLLDYADRLRRGEKPKVAAKPPSGPNARPPSGPSSRASTRKTSGSRTAGKKVARKKQTASRRGAGRNVPAKKRASRSKSASSEGGDSRSATKRGVLKKRTATKGAAKHSARKTSGGRPAARKTSAKRSSKASGPPRGPRGGGQRTPSSRKGTRR